MTTIGQNKRNRRDSAVKCLQPQNFTEFMQLKGQSNLGCCK